MKNENTYEMPYEGCLVGAAYQKMISQLETALNQNGLKITAAEYLILRALYSHDGLQQCEICEMVGKDKASISRSVSALNRKGLINTEPVSYKCIRVWLTDKAKEMRPCVLKVAEERHNALYALATPKDIESFVKVLKEIVGS